MSRPRSHHRWTFAALLLAALACVLAACGAGSASGPTGVTARGTATPTFALGTPTYARAITHLSVPAPDSIAVAPNGSYFATVAGSPSTVTIYDLSGTPYGHYTASAGETLNMLWLPDSSGLAVWKSSYQNTISGLLGIMDVDGTIHQTALAASCPIVSPDGQWIADTSGYGPSGFEIEVMARDGTAPRTVAEGGLIGWLGQRIVYATTDATYAVNVDGSGAVKLGVNVGISVCQQQFNPIQLLSPDQQVLLATGAKGRVWEITLNGVTQVPNPNLMLVPGLWAGPHAAYVTPDSTLKVVDVETGATLRDTGLPLQSLYLQAVAGDWVAALGPGTPLMLHILNLKTKADDALVSLSGAMQIYPVGTSEFLVKMNEPPGKVYLLDPALLGG